MGVIFADIKHTLKIDIPMWNSLKTENSILLLAAYKT